MICVDTTFLVDLWRAKNLASSPARRLLMEHAGEEFAVPAHAAGEFLEGGAAVSPERLADSLAFLRLFRIGEVGVETA
jgi:predicted nucleic acid-binding protein